MDDKPYSNREIQQFFHELKEQLNRIEGQTIKTNGRVNGLETSRSYMAGAIAVIILVGLPILGFLSYEVFRLATFFPVATTTNNTINK